MTAPEVDLTGLHFVRTKRGPLASRWQVYAFRGGPRIMTVDQIAKPKLDTAALGKLVEARTKPATKPQGDTFTALADAYLASPEYRRLADFTKRDYRRWIDRAKDEFKGAKVKWFDDPSMRADIIAWRDKWAHSPRQSRYALQVLSIVLDWGAERGWLMNNPVRMISKEYTANRSEIVWTDDEIEAVCKHMQPYIADAFRLAAWTGLARGDLVSLRWSEINNLYIQRKRNKTGVETIIPLFDQTRELLDKFKATQRGRVVSSVFVVTTSRGKQFKPTGFATAVQRAHKAAGVAPGKTLHDIRGTFATRLMQAGFSDSEVDEMLGWDSGNSARTRRSYISRRTVVESAIKRFQERQKSQ